MQRVVHEAGNWISVRLHAIAAKIGQLGALSFTRGNHLYLCIISDNIFFANFIQKLNEMSILQHVDIVCVNRTLPDGYSYIPNSIPYVHPKTFGSSPYGDATKYKRIFLFTLGSWLAPWVASIPAGPEVSLIIIDGNYLNLARRLGSTIGPATKNYFSDLGLLPDYRSDIPKIHRAAVARIDSYSYHLKYYEELLYEDFEVTDTRRFFFDFPMGENGDMPTSAAKAQELSNPMSGDGLTIVLGNSASLSCNYIDAINQLADMGLPQNIRVVAQLAYGDAKLVEPIANYGNTMLGKRFIPWTTLLREQEHFSLLAHSHAAIMPFLRSQGGRNIKLLLYLGKKIFLSTLNPMYHEYTASMGTVGKLETMTLDELLTPLTLEQRTIQQRVMSQSHNDQTTTRLYQELFSM